MSADATELPLLGGKVTLHQEPLIADYELDPSVSDEAMVHPYLAVAAGMASHWLGRDVYHGGAFVLDGGAWGVLADRSHGKSSTLGWLARQGVTVLSDDLVIVEEGVAYAGPSCIDLRPDAAQLLGGAESLGVVGARERWRLRLDPTITSAPLRGWVFLAWAETMGLRTVPATERIARIVAQRSVRGSPPPDPTTLIDHIALPCLELSRPEDLKALGTAVKMLIDAISS